MTIIAYITCSDEKEAKKIAKKLLGEKTIACANIIKEIESLYLWKGKMEKSREALLLCKTKKSLGEKLIRRVKELHSYEIPCIDIIEIKKSGRDYENWLGEVVEK